MTTEDQSNLPIDNLHVEVVSCRLEPQDTWQVCTKKLLAAINAIHERLDEMDERWSRRHEP